MRASIGMRRLVVNGRVESRLSGGVGGVGGAVFPRCGRRSAGNNGGGVRACMRAAQDGITLSINDYGISCKLSKYLPQYIAKNMKGYVDTLLGRHGLGMDDMDFWAVHPGGRRIIEEAQNGLGLTEEQCKYRSVPGGSRIYKGHAGKKWGTGVARAFGEGGVSIHSPQNT